MLILGINGGLDFPHEDMHVMSWNLMAHDSAAVLIHNGKVVAAIEEERINRIKHTGKGPIYSMQFCLDQYGVTLADVDRIVLFTAENESKYEVLSKRNMFNTIEYADAREWMAKRFQQFFGVEIPREKFAFVDHHTCHAASAYFMSGFDKSLVLTIDGASPEGFAGYVISAEGNSFQVLERISNDNSLGTFYNVTINILSYYQHDEYKVMGLAPYGNPSTYRRVMRKAYRLLPDGKFTINKPWLLYVLMDYVKPRRKGEPITQEHKDLAAALQEALETIVLHVLTYYREATGHTRLCLAGGVAHNCSMNGKILYSGLFDEVFVQPAAHDAGNSLGGALYVSKLFKPEQETETLRHLYWGTDIGNQDQVGDILSRWSAFVDYTRVDHIEEKTARLIADGAVIGWVQGRSEFGPRALGNRSILADPRPEENKHIINAMVKKREGYRPFAPSVLEEYAGEYYEIPPSKAPLSYMNFVLRTKEDKRAALGAVTHVDGTARVQTVSRETNERYWTLIDEFRKLTGIPILLNTSFNNNAEPIVNTEEDAIVSFLTTHIDYLVIGDYLVSKKEVGSAEHMQLAPKRHMTAELKKSIGCTADGSKQVTHIVRLHFGENYTASISEETFRLLEACDAQKTVETLVQELGLACGAKVMDELLELWSQRLIALHP
ncbi:carbamoyltransferase family protein [Gorillibacterium sp. sgz500922]|uniref:carbamoyltransferase family protein n=1 Tax=Gorillibacterium sp. sgz500922 TaxID=3446694 RepID=UPI003F6771DC